MKNAFLVVAVVCFVLDAFGVRVLANLQDVGLALAFGSFLVD